MQKKKNYKKLMKTTFWYPTLQKLILRNTT